MALPEHVLRSLKEAEARNLKGGFSSSSSSDEDDDEDDYEEGEEDENDFEDEGADDEFIAQAKRTV